MPTALSFSRGALRMLGAAGLLLALSSTTQAFEIPRRAVSCGATNTAGGSFQLKATIGESGPVSAIVSGGSFQRGEGFWPGFGAFAAVPVPPSVAEAAPQSNSLGQNQPNPFRGPTTIAFSVAEPSPVRLVVYDASGRRVAGLASGHRAAGHYRLDWDGLDASGQPVAGGIYFYRLDVGSWSHTKKMLKLR
jgi:hypothetical protein